MNTNIINDLIMEVINGKSIQELAELANKVCKSSVCFLDENDFFAYVEEHFDSKTELAKFLLNSEIGYSNWGFAERNEDGTITRESFIWVDTRVDGTPIGCWVPSEDFGRADFTDRLECVIKQEICGKLSEKIISKVIDECTR